jgi:DNA-nicking Smr family endonuclease
VSEDDEVFRQAMRDVRRIKAKERRPEPPPPSASRIHIEPSGPAHAADVGHSYPSPKQAAEPWVLRADGVSTERLRQLTSGRLKADAELDLHGMTREEAYAALSESLLEVIGRGGRVLCVVHGRGLHSKGGKPVLKEAVYQWLADGPYSGRVLAAVPAPGTGGGSCLVLLRRQRGA